MYALKSARFVTSAQNLTQCPPPLFSEVAFLGRSNVGKSTLINLLTRQKGLAKSSSTPGKTQLINFFETRWEGGAADGAERCGDVASEGAAKHGNHQLKSECQADGNQPLMSDNAVDCHAPNSAHNDAVGGDFKTNSQELVLTHSAPLESFTLTFVDLPGFGYAKVSKSQKELWSRALTDFLQRRDSIRLFLHLRDARHLELEIDANLVAFLSRFLRGDQRILTVWTKFDKLSQSEKQKLKARFPHDLFSSALKPNTKELAHQIAAHALGAALKEPQ